MIGAAAINFHSNKRIPQMTRKISDELRAEIKDLKAAQKDAFIERAKANNLAAESAEKADKLRDNNYDLQCQIIHLGRNLKDEREVGKYLADRLNETIRAKNNVSHNAREAIVKIVTIMTIEDDCPVPVYSNNDADERPPF